VSHSLKQSTFEYFQFSLTFRLLWWTFYHHGWCEAIQTHTCEGVTKHFFFAAKKKRKKTTNKHIYEKETHLLFATETLWRPDWSMPPQTSSYPAVLDVNRERWCHPQTGEGPHTAPTLPKTEEHSTLLKSRWGIKYSMIEGAWAKTIYNQLKGEIMV